MMISKIMAIYLNFNVNFPNLIISLRRNFLYFLIRNFLNIMYDKNLNFFIYYVMIFNFKMSIFLVYYY